MKIHENDNFRLWNYMRYLRNQSWNCSRNQKRLLCPFWTKISIDKDNFLIGMGNGNNRGKFNKRLDQVSRGSLDFSWAGNRVAAKVEFHYARKRLVTSQSSWLHNPNKIAGFEVPIRRWRSFGSTVWSCAQVVPTHLHGAVRLEG